MLLRALCIPPRAGLTKIPLHARRIMKITAIILLTACLSASANGDAQRLNLSLKNAPLEKVFSEIEKQTTYNFVYSDRMMLNTRKVTVEVTNAELSQVLDICFKDQPYTYVFSNKFIVVKPVSSPVVQPGNTNPVINEPPPPIDVKGRIVNEAGEGVPASVFVKGSNVGTSTDANGNFTLKNIDEKSTLIISGVSIQTFEIKVNSKTDLGTLTTKLRVGENENVQLSSGYQQVSRERFVGSAAKLDSAAFQRRAGMNVITRLDGTIPGLVFIKNAGNTPIQIRGISTLGQQGTGTAFNPLIVVDNFPFKGNMNNINPNDVESITVLRDAAATSIWGTQGGNGVIVITTRKGNYGQGLRISVSSNTTFKEKPDLYYQPQISKEDFVGVEKFLFSKGFYNTTLTNTSSRPIVSPVVEILAKRRSGLISASDSATQIASLLTTDVRDQLSRYIYRPGVASQHYINASGGSSTFNFLLGAGFNTSNAEVKGVDGDQQFTLNSSFSFKPVKNLEIESGINLAYNTIRSAGLGGTSILFPGKVAPYTKLADDAGNALAIPNDIRMSWADTAGGGKLLNWLYKPLEEIPLANSNLETALTRINVGLSYRFASWIKASVRFQHIQESRANKIYYNPNSYYVRNMINRFSSISGTTVTRRIPLGGILDLDNGLGITQQVRGQININKSWKGKHELTGLIAGDIAESKSSANTNRFYGYDDDLTTYATLLNYNMAYPIYGNLSGSQRIPQGAAVSEGANNRYVSVLANASYTYAGRYTFYASARRDGANVFGVNTNNRWKPLWSAGASWELTKEKFFKLPLVSSLRLRASYGYSGNVDNNRSGLATINLPGSAPYTSYPWAVVSTPPNPDLRWEQVGITNIALDFAILKNRLSGSFDWFRKKSTDLIAPTPVDPTTGILNFVVNVASLKSKGYEFRLNSVNLDGPLHWESSFALSYVKVIVDKYTNGGFKTSQFLGFGINPTEGQIAWGISSYKFAGLDPVTGDPQGMLNHSISKDYAKIFDDSIGNQIFHGSMIPLYTGFLYNSISWKGISVSANITYRLAYYFRKPTISYTALFNDWKGHADYSLRWQQPGDELHTTVPSLVYPQNQNRDLFYANSEVNVKRGDNIRWQDIRLAYDWKPKNRNSRIGNIQVFLYGNDLNIILWRKEKSVFDPDYQVIVTPPSRSITAGINFNF